MKLFLYNLSLLLIPVVIFLVLFTPKITPDASESIGCCPKNPNDELTDDYDIKQTRGEFLGRDVDVPEINESLALVLGDSTGNKRIEVDLGKQRVYGFDGSSKVFDFTVSTGKWGATPKGSFTIQRKVRAQKMSGGSKAKGTYYYLPNVPYVMFFGNQSIPWYRGYSFHGTYWHNNFGTPMSHGCINMRTPEAQQLYRWAPMGTPVNIY